MNKYISVLLILCFFISLCSCRDLSTPSESIEKTDFPTEDTIEEKTEAPTEKVTEKITDATPPEEPVHWATYTWEEVEQPDGEKLPFELDENGKAILQDDRGLTITSLWAYQQFLKSVPVPLPENFVSAEKLVQLGEFKEFSAYINFDYKYFFQFCRYHLNYNGTDIYVHIKHAPYDIGPASTRFYYDEVPNNVLFAPSVAPTHVYTFGGKQYIYEHELKYIGVMVDGLPIYIQAENDWVEALKIGRNTEWLVAVIYNPEDFLALVGIPDEDWRE